MTDSPMCNHLQVSQVMVSSPGGAITSGWACSECGMPFISMAEVGRQAEDQLAPVFAAAGKAAELFQDVQKLRVAVAALGGGLLGFLIGGQR